MTDKNTESNGTFIERRKSIVDRRIGLDRHRGPGHRRSDERKAAEEGEMTDEQFTFLMALESRFNIVEAISRTRFVLSGSQRPAVWFQMYHSLRSWQ